MNTITLLEEIEQSVLDKDISYIDAVMLYCERNNLEPEVMAKVVSKTPALLSKITFEAEELNFLKRKKHEKALPF